MKKIGLLFLLLTLLIPVSGSPIADIGTAELAKCGISGSIPL